MNPNKSSSLDNFTVAFFKCFQEQINVDIMSLVHDFFDERADLSHINRTFITLISKISGATLVAQYLSISRINKVYELITIFLTQRVFYKVAPNLISTNQMMFIKGRLIVHNYDGFRQILTPRRACVSIDPTKAFDSVSWNATCSMLCSIRVSMPFIKMIYYCISMPTFSIIMEGEPSQQFTSERCLAGGSPLPDIIQSCFGELVTELA